MRQVIGGEVPATIHALRAVAGGILPEVGQRVPHLRLRLRDIGSVQVGAGPSARLTRGRRRAVMLGDPDRAAEPAARVGADVDRAGG